MDFDKECEHEDCRLFREIGMKVINVFQENVATVEELAKIANEHPTTIMLAVLSEVGSNIWKNSLPPDPRLN